MKDILEFRGPTRWLSNFHVEDFEWQGKVYASSEHAYQAAKATTEEEHEHVRLSRTPGVAKRRGQKVQMRPDWNDVRVDVMYSVLKAKFAPEKLLALRLVETGDAHLEEGNNWGDVFWGVCDGAGENNLGKVLMRIRQELRDSGLVA